MLLLVLVQKLAERSEELRIRMKKKRFRMRHTLDDLLRVAVCLPPNFCETLVEFVPEVRARELEINLALSPP
jgi:hypothetical protein